MDIASNRTRAALAAAAVAVMIAGCGTAATDFEYIYLPGTELESGANLPFTPAIKVRGGNIVFLSGITVHRSRTATRTSRPNSIISTSMPRSRPSRSWSGCSKLYERPAAN